MGGRQPSIVGRGGHIVIVLSGRSELGLGEMPRGTGAPRNLSLGGPHDRRRHAQSEGLHDHLEAQETRRPETGPPVLVARSRGAILRFPSTCLHRSWWVGAPRGVSMPGRPQYEACMRDGPPGRCDLPAGAVLVMPSPMRPPAMPASGRGRRHCSLRSCSHVVVELVEPLLSRGRPEGSGGRGAPGHRLAASWALDGTRLPWIRCREPQLAPAGLGAWARR